MLENFSFVKYSKPFSKFSIVQSNDSTENWWSPKLTKVVRESPKNQSFALRGALKYFKWSTYRKFGNHWFRV